MSDKCTVAQRSKTMASVKSSANKTTEISLIKLMRLNHITGWRRNQHQVFGKPDFVFTKQKIAIFVDGCFWHRCRKCKKIPASNTLYWTKKINNNRRRDVVVTKTLKSIGWTVIRIWEHELKSFPDKVILKIIKNLQCK